MPGAAPVKNEQETQARLTRDEERTQRRVLPYPNSVSVPRKGREQGAGARARVGEARPGGLSSCARGGACACAHEEDRGRRMN